MLNHWQPIAEFRPRQWVELEDGRVVQVMRQSVEGTIIRDTRGVITTINAFTLARQPQED